jgi:FO synthase
VSRFPLQNSRPDAFSAPTAYIGPAKPPPSNLAASRLRDQGKGRTVTYSPKVFIPLTRLCRDFCSYCTFRESPQQADVLYMSPEQVLDVLRAGQRLGCREALFVLGERPEERYPEARRWLHERGYDSTIEYLYEICKLTLSETALYPHSNAGNLTARELEALKAVNVSMGLMLENVSERLCAPGGPHERAPSKHPRVRLETLRQAGELKVPFTTGLLIGMGETAKERTDSLLAIRDLHRQYGHIQEVIIQNFQPKADTLMRLASGPSLPEMLDTLAEARLLLGPEMNIQAPPNLARSYGPGARRAYLDAGINDWGGISPLTIDYVNPEAPWPELLALRQEMKAHGFQLRGRYAIYPEYILHSDGFLTDGLKQRLLQDADSEGFIPRKDPHDDFGRDARFG